jgi:hypothetical protein
VRATGKLHLDVAGSGGVTAVNEATHAPSGTEEHRFKISATGTATLRGVGDDLTWAFNATPDKPPTIALTKDPEQQNRGAMLLVLPRRGRLRHDRSARDLRPQGRAGGEGRRSASAVYGPPDFSLILPQARTKSGVVQTIKDVTDHPWAGAEVVMTLTARDEGGNEGRSEPFAFRLPERAFTKQLAKALVEQRRNLALRRPRPFAGHHCGRCADPRAGQIQDRGRHLSRAALDLLVAGARQERRRPARGSGAAVVDGGRPGGWRYFRSAGGLARRAGSTAQRARVRGREYGDDYTVKVPGEIDVQRARRIIEELRRRFGDVLRPHEELDYIERLLKDY